MGVIGKAATYDGNSYAKNWISTGSQTITRNDCDLPKIKKLPYFSPHIE